MPDAKDSAGLHSEASADPRTRRLVPLALVFYGVLLAVAVAWRLGVDAELPWRATPPAPPWPLAARLAAGIAYGSLLIAASRLWTAHSEAGRRLSNELARAIGPVRPSEALALAAISGLAEEAFFRGALQPQVGWPLATLLFALAHFHPRQDLRVWSLSAAIAGLGFAALFDLTGDLLAPAIAHATLNAINLRWLSERNALTPTRP